MHVVSRPLSQGPHQVTSTHGLGRVCKKMSPLLGLICAFGFFGATTTTIARGEPHAFERKHIEAQAQAAFHAMIRLWAEENYFALYKRGLASSRNALEQEEFVRRMVLLKYLPAWPLNPAQVQATMRFRGVVYVRATVVYHPKQKNKEKSVVRRQTFLLMRENSAWRMDLLRIIRGIFY